MRKHQNKVKCVNCNLELSKRCMAQHMESCGKQKNKKVHKCDTCGYEARSVKRLEVHNKKHNKVPHQCEYCEYQTDKSCHLQRHLKRCLGKKRKAPPPGPVTNSDLTDVFSKMEVSKGSFNDMVKFFKSKFGEVSNICWLFNISVC